MRSISQVELVTSGLNDWFAQRLTSLKYSKDTIAYVVGVLSKYKNQSDDLSDQSIVLLYITACENSDFSTYQKIGDWVLWTSTICPDSIKENQEIVQNLGRMSYYACNRIIRSWPVYEDLGNNLEHLAIDVRLRLLLI